MLKFVARLPKAQTALAIFFLLIQIVCGLYLPALTADIINNGVLTGNVSYIWSYGGIMLCIACVGFTAAVVNTFISSKIAYAFGARLRQDVFNKVMSFAKREFDQISGASLLTRNINDVAQMQFMVEMALKFMIMAPLYLIGGIIMAYRLSPELAMVFICAAPLIAILTMIIFRKAGPLYSKKQNAIDCLNLIFREGLTGIKVIRSFNKCEYEYKRFTRASRGYRDVSLKANLVISFLIPVSALVINLAAVAITWLGAEYAQQGGLAIGTVVGVIAYSTQILMGFLGLANTVSYLPRSQISAKRVSQALDLNLSVKNLGQATIPNNTPASLALGKACFTYPGARRNALDQISFEITAGQTLAVLGGTGSGKSTLVSLITRGYDTTAGNISFCGTNIKEIELEELNRRISLVAQKPFLFYGSVRENLRLGRPNAGDAEIWQALDLAMAADFVRQLPDGLDSTIEKNGNNFSGGQKQRLCIARALLKKSAVYIFDDAFSALDFKTDAIIRANLKAYLHGAITIIVAQRIGTILLADKIALLDEGRLVGLGTHQELKASNAIYQEIIASQLKTGWHGR